MAGLVELMAFTAPPLSGLNTTFSSRDWTSNIRNRSGLPGIAAASLQAGQHLVQIWASLWIQNDLIRIQHNIFRVPDPTHVIKAFLEIILKKHTL